jgi:hypothetical protein
VPLTDEEPFQPSPGLLSLIDGASRRIWGGANVSEPGSLEFRFATTCLSNGDCHGSDTTSESRSASRGSGSTNCDGAHGPPVCALRAWGRVTLGQDYLPSRVGATSGIPLGLTVSIGGPAAPCSELSPTAAACIPPYHPW